MNKSNTLIKAGIAASLGLAVIPAVAGYAATSSSGAVRLNAEVSSAIAMKIVSPNDVDPNCTPEDGVTYGVVNRYAMSNGTEGSKQVDTFDGREGEKDEINENTSCATLTMTPNTYDSTYSDVSVYTNAPSGFSLSLAASQPNLVNILDSSQNIPAGVLTENSGTVPGGQNLWSYKTDANIITGWTAMSDTETTIKSYEQETTGGDTTKITYGVSTGTNPTGTYATNVTYTATAFDGANPYVGNVQATETANLSITPLSLAIPLKTSKSLTVTPAEGYYLSEVTCPENYTCSGYSTDKSDSASAAAQSITITNQNAGSGIATLGLAVEKLADYMQDFKASAHSSDPTGTVYTLTDLRNEKEYTAKKLADGNIWMTQNLRLVGPKVLYGTDTNLASDTTTFNLTASDSGTWCTDNNSTCDDKSMVLDTGRDDYGTYYNWYAATAGSGTYSTGANVVASYSICPKGWKLPTPAQFQTLYNNYNSSALMRDANGPAFVLSGYRLGSSTGNQGSDGYFWSSTAYSSVNAYNLYLNSSNVYPQNGSNKWNGFTVRCIAAS